MLSSAHYSSIDDILGDKRGRYFGAGYTRSFHSISDFSARRRDGTVQFTCIGSVRQPADWSNKGDVNQAPHLTTIDMIELSIICLQSLTMGDRGGAGRQEVAIRRMAITAGKSAIGGDLKLLAIRGEGRRVDEDHHTLTITIANATISIDYAVELTLAGIDGVWTRNAVSLSGLTVEQTNLMAWAVMTPVGEGPVDSWSISTCFAAILQIGQVLLYGIDNLRRDDTNTLWMKKTIIKINSPVPMQVIGKPVTARLEDVRRYTKSGNEWRRADICGIVSNTEINCSVTHQLPT